ncbi:MAG: hypothetical protein JHC33_04360 [Ignisphaera sp.]|nr:hypothetical protein [Ignisphaera sp.]
MNNDSKKTEQAQAVTGGVVVLLVTVVLSVLAYKIGRCNGAVDAASGR